MSANECIQVRNHLQNQDTEHFRHHQVLPWAPFTVCHLSPHSALVTHWSDVCHYSSALSRMSYTRNHIFCSFLCLAIFTLSHSTLQLNTEGTISPLLCGIQAKEARSLKWCEWLDSGHKEGVKRKWERDRTEIETETGKKA